MTSKQDIIAVVLAGGLGLRMGCDKALMHGPTGITLLAGVCMAANEAGLPVAVVGRDHVSLPKDMPADCIVIPDDMPGAGPLAGLATALRLVGRHSTIILCPCDVPYLSSQCFDWIVSEWEHADAESYGLVSVYNGRPQPLFAVYRSNLLTHVNTLVYSGKRSLHALLDTAKFQYQDLPAHLAGAVADWDEPQDATIT